MKSIIGVVLAFALGLACRIWNPVSSATADPWRASGDDDDDWLFAVDRWLASPAWHARDCGGPSGLSASQALSKGAEH